MKINHTWVKSNVNNRFESLILVINFNILFFSWKTLFWETHWWNVVSCIKAETLWRFEFMRFVSGMNILKMLLWADIVLFLFFSFVLPLLHYFWVYWWVICTVSIKYSEQNITFCKVDLFESTLVQVNCL